MNSKKNTVKKDLKKKDLLEISVKSKSAKTKKSKPRNPKSTNPATKDSKNIKSKQVSNKISKQSTLDSKSQNPKRVNTKITKPSTLEPKSNKSKDIPKKSNKSIEQIQNRISKEPPKIIKKNLVRKINTKSLMTDTQKSKPFISDLFANIEKNLFTNIYFQDESRVLLAVSGGVDSISLLDIFANLTKRYPLMKLFIAHFNHRLRGEESQKDEIFVKQLAKNYNIEFYNARGNVNQYSKQKNVSIEHAARTLRYKFFERTSKLANADYVVTAHTADDSAETFFINLFRGAGITGLSGIPIKRSFIKRTVLIRPLLTTRKKDLIKYAKLRQLKWRKDASNSMLFYTRNRVRHELLPLIESKFSESIIDIINRSQKLFQGADLVILKDVQKALQLLICQKAPGRFALKIPLLSTYEEFMQGEIIQKALNNNFDLQNVSMQTIDRIIAITEKNSGAICEIDKNHIALKDRTCLIFSRRLPIQKINFSINKIGEFDIRDSKIILTEVTKQQVKFSNNPKIEYLDMDIIPARLFLRSWELGDSFSPLGMDGSMKLSDFFTNQKISLIDKQNQILLTSMSEIIWICGMRINDKFKVTDSTVRFLKAELISK